MKTSSAFLLLFSYHLAIADEAQVPNAALHFVDGTSLSGHPEAYPSEDEFSWQSPFFRDQTNLFRWKSIDEITFDYSSLPDDSAPAEQVLVHFNPHYDRFADSLPANLTSFDKETVTLNTWYAGALTLKRNMLSSIVVKADSAPLYRGPLPLKNWKIIDDNPHSWVEVENGLQTKQSSAIAQEFPDLPKRLKLSFRLTSPNYTYLSIILFADSSVTKPENCYYLEIRGSSQADLKKYKQSTTEAIGVMARQRFNMDESQETNYELYINTERGEFALYSNGEQSGLWTDPKPFRPGDWFTFHNRVSREQTLSQMTIRPWNGELPNDLSENESDILPGEGERIELRNGDTILGSASKVIDSKLLVETQYGSVAVPIELLRSFQITAPKDENYEEPRMWTKDVRAHFHDGGHITLRLSAISPTHITGYSQVFGEATFDLRAFSHIQFSPYDDELRIKRGINF